MSCYVTCYMLYVTYDVTCLMSCHVSRESVSLSSVQGLAKGVQLNYFDDCDWSIIAILALSLVETINLIMSSNNPQLKVSLDLQVRQAKFPWLSS